MHVPSRHPVSRLTSFCTSQAHREQLLSTILREILDIWNELGISPSTSTSTTTDQLDLSILHTLGISVPSSSTSTVLTANYSTLTSLREKKESLEAERERRMLEIQAIYDELYLLWSKLGVSDEDADEFVELWKGTEERCIEAVSGATTTVSTAYFR